MSTTDPDSRLYRKSNNTASILCYQGHALMENRHGLVVGAVVTHADGTGERAVALAMRFSREPIPRWARTRPMTCPTSWPPAAAETSPSTLRKTTIGAAAAPSTGARHGMSATQEKKDHAVCGLAIHAEGQFSPSQSHAFFIDATWIQVGRV